jgi:hypothetical protein
MQAAFQFPFLLSKVLFRSMTNQNQFHAISVPMSCLLLAECNVTLFPVSNGGRRSYTEGVINCQCHTYNFPKATREICPCKHDKKATPPGAYLAGGMHILGWPTPPPYFSNVALHWSSRRVRGMHREGGGDACASCASSLGTPLSTTHPPITFRASSATIGDQHLET